MRCPEMVTILDLFEDRLRAPERKKIEAHVAECSKCAQTKAWATKTLRLMHTDSLRDAPEHVVQQAIKSFLSKQTSSEEWIPAKLEFDSWMVPAMQGIRASNRGPRQWVYQTKHYKIILMLQQQQEDKSLVGQLVPLQPGAETRGCLVEIMSKSKPQLSKVTNANGEFLIPAVKGKTLKIRIHAEVESVVISVAA
jgi:hypothetical protein